MKVAIVADTHRHKRAIDKVVRVLQAEAPDRILHLGDNVEDAVTLSALLGQEVLTVAGNTDYSFSDPDERVLKLGGHTLYMVHGHFHQVKGSLAPLARAARGKGADIALYGHTHVALETEQGGVRIFNPGSAALPREGQKPSLGMLELQEAEVTFRLVHLPSGEK